MLPAELEIAAASIIGRDHVWFGKNNQDAWCWALPGSAAILIVCDGCSSGTHSEVGAKLGARMAVGAIQQELTRATPRDADEIDGLLEVVREKLLQQLRALAAELGANLAAVVQDFLLFTITGALITEKQTALFALGDGVLALNGEVLRVGPFPGNEPPYLAYALIDSLRGFPKQALRFQVLRTLPTEQLNSVLVASDGAAGWDAFAERQLPGRAELAGPLNQFWSDERYFRNKDLLRRRLALMNREVNRTDWSNRRMTKDVGLLSDDTTIVICRRKEIAPA